MFDMDKERSIHFTPGKWIRHDYFLPLVAVAAFLAFIRLVYFPWSEADFDWPSWVQAVGSVLAICAAVLISKREVISRQDERVDEAFLYMNKAHAIAAYGAGIVRLAAEYIEEGRPTVRMLDYHATLLTVALGDLEAVDAMKLESEQAVHAYLAIKRGVILTRATIQNAVSDEEGSFNLDQVAEWKTHMAEQMEVMQDGILTFVKNDTRLWDRLPE